MSLLTPKGVGAIATVEVSGPRAWELARTLFRPAGKPLPDAPELHRFWFGTLGEGAGDEVVLAVAGESTVEVHCHGGRRVVRWVIDQFLAHGCAEREPTRSVSVLDLLVRAPTLRTAGILLDQLHGTFDSAVRRILASPDLAGLPELARFASVGRHLVTPWKVVIAGPPNVGKSSLVNALAGYQRTVVSDVAGTTRDAVRVQLAFDGWPVELTDTAGLRDAVGLEAEGIERGRRVLSEADVVVWVMDGTSEKMIWPGDDIPVAKLVAIVNKSDAIQGWGPDANAGDARELMLVSAKTGHGVPKLVAEIVRCLIPDPPPPGAAVPYSPELADRVEAAVAATDRGEAVRLLRDCLTAG
ncbi:trna modification gtpase : Small GTP-binding protein domain protein OS=Singulisphaera acidiphila (strain ATCC BAA-1392 / DSM 18658 / VKM B-2454 / MOB10) GN=Sinac_6522 PE=4 SV=1: TrmE_N: MMR_HSR1 [Gemmataceae bacterium]|nr:trna modification gtpase : Small GTP-binding protein domain protein OS=Singulisphaera acidiphila (strain ATCC BAA-1392 / DSM 18658 / VKM B-2454 / MOB10) GN=Sinac_6522 PE=4 SV=1: TrmE_N: MMR_HSR1 [Gemmataceae bacterium]VTT97336.1 trna modification gtpase : Small GTP-binding protein domain protein OS=Singulisphaera acidiphila (strain ATCC BAA-1392 / DSM 18658 / VKM B-2454 / MOB10) GN=Sinac_6522 PE=4 SV=1: TrmE_N: MMR_HSR1 [Gemmataceae bacterium]